VAARGGDTKDLGRLFHPFTIQTDAGERRIVRHEVLRYVVVENAPVARVVVVDRLDVAPDEFLVLLDRHPRSSL
jgi:hypothetical protein